MSPAEMGIEGQEEKRWKRHTARSVLRSNMVLIGCSLCYAVSCAALCMQITHVGKEYLGQLYFCFALTGGVYFFLFHAIFSLIQLGVPSEEPQGCDAHPLARTARFVLLLLPFLLIKPLVVATTFFGSTDSAPPVLIFLIFFPFLGHLVIASIRFCKDSSSVLDSLLLGIVCTSFTVSVAQVYCQIAVLFFSLASASLSHLHFIIRRREVYRYRLSNDPLPDQVAKDVSHLPDGLPLSVV